MAADTLEGGAVRWSNFDWLYVVIFLPVAGYMAWWGVNKAKASLHRFVSPDLAKRLSDDTLPRSRKMRVITLSLAALLIAISLARPQYGVKPVEVKRSGIDVIIALDTSKSMAARDVKPDRLTRAKNEISKLLKNLEGNRIGLIAFAGKSFVECPLTMDVSTLKMFLDSLHPGSIPVAGTNIGDAIADAVKAFEAGKSRSRALILVTDGENLTGDVLDAARVAAKAHVNIFPIGIGSESGAPVPEIDSDGELRGYKKDKSGSTVMSRLDIATLQSLANESNGELFTSMGETLDLAPLYETLSRMEKTDITSREFTEYEERYQIAAILALILLLADYLLLEPNIYRRPE